MRASLFSNLILFFLQAIISEVFTWCQIGLEAHLGNFLCDLMSLMRGAIFRWRIQWLQMLKPTRALFFVTLHYL